MRPDFEGYATKANVKCSDGRTIDPDAFAHQNNAKVPLVWHHVHTDPDNVLGHVLLTHRPDGMYAQGFLNKSKKAESARAILEHDDVDSLSIWANHLVEKAGRVMHGMIREVSLVLAGANPAARIENVTIQHSENDVEVLADEAIIFTGDIAKHADNEEGSDDGAAEDTDESEETVEDVYETMTDKQKTVVHYLVGEALQSSKTLQQSSTEPETETKTEETQTDMNVFEKDAEAKPTVLSHADMAAIVADATKTGSLKAAVENYAIAHGIENIDILFPEARALTTTPEWITRRMEWVSSVLGGAKKSPFARIKTWTADLTYEEARAKGYVTGSMKKDQYFTVAKRITTPQTVYKRQKLDRDDIIDITDFDVVAWVKGDMRVMLDEELARAILIGDGRAVDDEDKIQEDKIRPIAGDDPFYTVTVNVVLDGTPEKTLAALDTVVANRRWYKGSGNPTFYTTEVFIAQCLTLRDKDGHRMFRTLADLAAELRVRDVVPVEVLETRPDIVGIIVNMTDYSVGADRGGQVTMFDDFDIDYNQYKYLIETRMSGALNRPKSAMVIASQASAAASVTATPPTWDKATHTVSVPTVAGVTYMDATGAEVTGDIVLQPGQDIRINAYADAGKFLAAGRTEWTFMRPSGS